MMARFIDNIHASHCAAWYYIQQTGEGGKTGKLLPDHVDARSSTSLKCHSMFQSRMLKVYQT